MHGKYPRILIFSQSFNTISGGGITLSSLFSSWPKDQIAVLSYPYMLTQITFDICDTYYQIGSEELHWSFPFSIIKEKHASGLVDRNLSNPLKTKSNKDSIRTKLSSVLLSPTLRRMNLVHRISRLCISKKLFNWLIEFKPDLLYFQISNRESINFAIDLIDNLNVPSVIHMMDDWPSTLGRQGILASFWKRKIDSEFRKLLNQIDLHLSICDAMSSEYQRRYGYNFISFHNTLDLGKWTPFIKKDLSLKEGIKTILFSGRIGKGIEQSLFELAAAVDMLQFEGVAISLHIQSPRPEPGILDQLINYESVKVNMPIDYNKIPELYSAADILVLANDFSRSGIRFLKYSMPTKAPEYMISGTPILVYASSETALYKMFKDNRCGHCVANQSPTELANAIRLLLHDLEYRKTLSRNAVAYAMEHFDSEKVRQSFQNLLLATAKIQDRVT